MQDRFQITTYTKARLLILGQRSEHSPLFHCPPEVINHIMNAPLSEHDEALKAVAFGQKDKLKTMLDKNHKLVLLRGMVITPAGLEVQDTTLLECAIGIGDRELIELITPYFSQVQDGAIKLEEQKARYRSCIEALATQKPDDDLTELFNMIERSSLKDVREELKTGKDYNREYQSELRTELNKWRNKKLDSKRRILKEPRMHCNLQNFIHADELLNKRWDALIVKGNHRGTFEKHWLVAEQILGFIELSEFTEDLRYIFARGQFEEVIGDKNLSRFFEFKHGSGAFPVFDEIAVAEHSGMGFHSYVSIKGDMSAASWDGRVAVVNFLKIYVEQTLQSLQKFMQQPQLSNRPGA